MCTCKSQVMTCFLLVGILTQITELFSLTLERITRLEWKLYQLAQLYYDNNKYVIPKTKPIYAAGDIRETTSEKVTNVWFAGRWTEILKPIIKHNDAKLNRSRNYQATNNSMPLFTRTTSKMKLFAAFLSLVWKIQSLKWTIISKIFYSFLDPLLFCYRQTTSRERVIRIHDCLHICWIR